MKHLTYTERLIIEKHYNKGASYSAIARLLCRSVSTIFTEVKRGLYTHLNSSTYEFVKRYSADIAQADADFRATAKGGDIKLGHNYAYAEEVSVKLQNGYAPDRIVGEKRRNGEWTVCTTTLYTYIDRGYIPGVTNSNLFFKSNKKKRKKKKVASRAPFGRTIEKRPSSVKLRALFGDWEMDTVVGKAKGKEQVLLVLTERKTRYELIYKLPDKTAKSVVDCLKRIHKTYGNIFRTLTVDNGCEFSDDRGIECALSTTLYYCHPYSSFERGSNENANRLIRRFLPKGTSFHNVTQADCDTIRDYINRMPRKILGYASASELFNMELKKF